MRVTRANGQPAFGAYAWDEDAGRFEPFALNVLSLRGDKIKDVTAFVVRTTDVPQPESFQRWVEHPADDRRLESVFERFGLPHSL